MIITGPHVPHQKKKFPKHRRGHGPYGPILESRYATDRGCTQFTCLMLDADVRRALRGRGDENLSLMHADKGGEGGGDNRFFLRTSFMDDPLIAT